MSDSEDEVVLENESGDGGGEEPSVAADTKSDADFLLPADQVISVMRETFEQMRITSREDANGIPLNERKSFIDKMLSVLLKEKEDVVAALSADFGCRSRNETLLAEVFTCMSHFKFTKSHIKGWAGTENRSAPWFLFPSKAYIQNQPKGVVGILSPWNYPVYLAIAPIASAIAAGNRVLLKPSEMTPKTSLWMAKYIAKIFPKTICHVVLGELDVASEFSKLPFDHIAFTGSPRVGKIIYKAAAENMTPVTLELGGKSPCIVGSGYDVKTAAKSIVYGKLLNAGQTCVAPDYIFVQESRVKELIGHLTDQISYAYPTLANNPDFTAIINLQQYDRINRLIEDAKEKGADIIQMNHAQEEFPREMHKIPPTFVLNPTEEMFIMQEEIFGPVAPVMTYSSIDEVVKYVNSHPRPLALYYFGEQKAERNTILNKTLSGGVTLNDTILHCALDDLPFGGVGTSGFGLLHGVDAFREFSSRKGVFFVSRLTTTALMRPPYGATMDKMLSWFLK